MARQSRIALHDGVDFAVRAFHQSNAGLLEPLDGRKPIIPAINPDRAFTRKCGDEGLPHILLCQHSTFIGKGPKKRQPR